MQFRDLKKQYVALKEEIDNGIQAVIDSTSFISGKQVEILEKELAEYVGVKHCITCANGTDALSMALMAWDLKEGECAFVPDFTFFASGETVSFVGATPVFVDVDERTFNMKPEKLEEAIAAKEAEMEANACDYEKYGALYAEKEAMDEQLLELMEKWEKLAEEAGE